MKKTEEVSDSNLGEEIIFDAGPRDEPVEEPEEEQPPTIEQLIDRYIELDKKKAAIKEFWEEYDKALSDLVDAVGLGWTYQDDEGVVYRTEKCFWKQVKITPFKVARTRREGERSGDLSMIEARKAGYVIEGK